MKNLFSKSFVVLVFGFLVFFSQIQVLWIASSAAEEPKNLPKWFVKPKQNNSSNLYGVAQGSTLEEATRFALSDAAGRLITTISSESNLIREENKQDFNEELRQNVRQSVEKINFTNFLIKNSSEDNGQFFIEVEIDRPNFTSQQKEDLEVLNNKISNLDKNSAKTNEINRRNALIKISEIAKEVEIKTRILSGLGANVNLKETLANLEKYRSELEKFSDKIEFYFAPSSNKEISAIIRNQLNSEKIKVVTSENSANRNQIRLKISSQKSDLKVYDFMTKIEIDFENYVDGKIIASNTIEVSGSSVIGYNESYKSALKDFEEYLQKNGALKTLGIIN